MILHDGAPVLKPRADLSYYDSRSILIPVALSPLEAWNLMMEDQPRLMQAAFRIRDAVSARFGVKRIGGFSGQRRESVQTGDRLDFFLVEQAAPDLLVLTERDRHLDVMLSLTTLERKLTVTASVVTHNAFGRAYMLAVGPAHRLIVRRYLRSLKRRLEAR